MARKAAWSYRLVPVAVLFLSVFANGQIVINEHVTVRGSLTLSKKDGVKFDDVDIGPKEDAGMHIKSGTYKADIHGGPITIDKAHFLEGELGGPHEDSQQTGYVISNEKVVIAKNADMEVSDDLTITAPEMVHIEAGHFKVDGNLNVDSQNVLMTADRKSEEITKTETKRGGFLRTSKHTSEHREHHDTAVPTHIDADSVVVNADMLVTDGTKIKAARGIRFDASKWLNLAVQDHHCVQNEVKRSGLFHTSHKVSGRCWTETHHTQLDPGEGTLTLNVQEVEATVGLDPGQSLEKVLNQLVSTYPELSWITHLQSHHRVHWETIENMYEEWNHKSSGISPLLGIIVSAAVTVATYGTGASLLPATMSSNLIATNAANAAFSSLVAKSAVDLANNKGNIGQTLEQLFTEDTVKIVAMEAIAAGLMGTTNTPYLISPKAPLAQRIHEFGVRIASHTGANFVVHGGSLGEYLADTLSSEAWQEVAAQANYWAGDYAELRGWSEGGTAKVALHSAVGSVLGELKDGKLLAGALAGGTAQVVAGLTEELSQEVQGVTSTIFAAITAQISGGDPQTGAWIGHTQHQYNRELHLKEAEFLQAKMKGKDEEEQAQWLAAACAQVRCSEEIDPDDRQRYDTIKALELAGWDYTEKLAELETSGLFTYTKKDAVEDFLSRHHEGITRFAGIVQTLAGVGSAAGSVAGGSVLCTTGVGCGLGALITAFGVQAGLEDYRDGIEKLTAKYTSDQAKRVEASFYPDTHPGEQSRLEELGRLAVVAVAEMAVTKLGLKSCGNNIPAGKRQADLDVDEKDIKFTKLGDKADVFNSLATNVNAHHALRGKLSGLQKSQNTAVKTRQLPDGRVRYYSKETPADKPGPTRGRAFVTEYNPKTNQVRQWMECYDKQGDVIRVHPKSIDGQVVDVQHYPPTAKELGLK